MPDLRILVIAEEALARAGLAALLTAESGLRVVGQLGAVSISDLELYDPDLIVFDLGWDVEHSVEILRELAETELPLLALVPDDEHASIVWASGVRGLLLRETDGATLLAALRGMEAGLVVLDSSLATVSPPVSDSELEQPSEALTPREKEVLQHLAEGLSNRAIALKLEISDHTVKFHVNAIMGKLGAQSRTDAVVRATRLGLIVL